MAGKNPKSLYRSQKDIRPKVEDVIPNFIEGEARETALAFAAYLRANKMPPQWGSANSWTVSHKNKRVCYINLGEGTWRIRFCGDYSAPVESMTSDEALQSIALAGVSTCTGCSTCGPGRPETILGRELDNVCNSWTFIFHDPTPETMRCVKALIDERREHIETGRVDYVGKRYRARYAEKQ